jgi:methyltransferase (TIGR00027 family)
MTASIGARTRLIDDAILGAIRDEGIETVLNLACGMDTRPYRMSLPSALRWIEADFPALMELKDSRLAGAKPICHLERYRVDLADPVARGAFFKKVLYENQKTLVLTEGLLFYLEPHQVEALARELRQESAVKLWIADLVSARVLALARQTWGRRLKKRKAPLQFGFRFSEFQAWGWHEREVTSIFQETYRLKRDFPAAPLWRPLFKLLPQRLRSFFNQGYVISIFE